MATADYPTEFAESNALLLLQSGDEESAQAILDGFLHGELVVLAAAASRLETLATRSAMKLDHDKGLHEGYARKRSIDARSWGCPTCHAIAGLQLA
jgi:hypothetical protein